MPEARKNAVRSGRAAPRASKACDQCRAWRLRCDGDHPACTRCARRGQACSWSGLDRRRKGSDVAELSAQSPLRGDNDPAPSPLNVLADAASSSRTSTPASKRRRPSEKGHLARQPAESPSSSVNGLLSVLPAMTASTLSNHIGGHSVYHSQSAPAPMSVSHDSASLDGLGPSPSLMQLANSASFPMPASASAPAAPSFDPESLQHHDGGPRTLWWERDLLDMSPFPLGNTFDNDAHIQNRLDVSQLQPQNLSQEVLDSLIGRSAWISGMSPKIVSEDGDKSKDSSALSDAVAQAGIGADAEATPSKPVRLQYFRLMGPTAISSGVKLMSMDLHLTPSAQKALLRSTTPSQMRADLRKLDWERWKQMIDPSAAGSAAAPDDLSLGEQLDGSDSASEEVEKTLGAGRGSDRRVVCKSAAKDRLQMFDGDFPRQDILDDLLPHFYRQLGDHYPCLSVKGLDARLRDAAARPSLAMLVNAMCSLSARFSSHPDVVGGRSRDSIYTQGKVFAERSKTFLATSLSVPSKVTTLAFLLLAWHEFACNLDSAFWNYAGMALRMAVDLGLQHRVRRMTANSPSDSGDFIHDELLFWSAFSMDRNLVMGTGRPTSIKDNEITLPLPDIKYPPGSASPVFALLIRHKMIGGKVAEALNRVISAEDGKGAASTYEHLDTLESELISSYEAMPPSLRISAANLRAHQGAGQQHVFVEMHLWFHLLLFVLNRPPIAETCKSSARTDASSLVRKSVQRCAEIVALDDANDASILTCVPMANQTLFLAACAELDEVAALKHRLEAEESSAPGSATVNMLNHLVRETLDSYQHFAAVLQRMSVYFKGVGWIHGVLMKREKGICDSDLVELAVGTDAFVSQEELRLLRCLHSSDVGRPQATPPREAPLSIKISDIPDLRELTSLFPELE